MTRNEKKYCLRGDEIKPIRTCLDLRNEPEREI